MANTEHVEILKRGMEVWNKWREENPEVEPDLSQIDLFRMDLSKANMRKVNFSRTNLGRTNLCSTDLSYADLAGANFYRADLSHADLRGTNLYENDLRWAILSDTDLRGATLINCSIYAVSAWGVRLEGTRQANLIITNQGEAEITVDNLEIAQFIYLLLNNQKIRHVIDTITSKVVLILGLFTPERKQVLDALKDGLRSYNYSPVVFDCKEYSCESFIETARTLANMAHFVLIDLTDIDDVIGEIITSIVPQCIVPIQPLSLGNHRYDHVLFRDLQQRYRWVLSPRRYKDISGLLVSFQEHIIQSAENKIIELKQRKPLKIFFGSALEDRAMLDRLKKHLSVLERSGQIEMWDDRDIEPGNNREEVIERQLSDARIILLLISPDFLASNDCYTLQEKAMQGNAKVIPVLLRPCHWKSTSLGNLQVLPRDERPIEKHSLDEVFFEVSEEISDVIKEMM